MWAANPGGPMSLTAGGRAQVEGGKTESRTTRSTFNLPPSTEAKRWHEVPTADGVREVEDQPEFSVRYGRA